MCVYVYMCVCCSRYTCDWLVNVMIAVHVCLFSVCDCVSLCTDIYCLLFIVNCLLICELLTISAADG
jgi:hypothetical protein